jgi:mRNA-degrading endonuclease YafQ of YafQ-DinJ toxin-antitoxin module
MLREIKFVGVTGSAARTTASVTSSPDLLLIYRKPDPNTLRLARLGSHSELFG